MKSVTTCGGDNFLGFGSFLDNQTTQLSLRTEFDSMEQKRFMHFQALGSVTRVLCVAIIAFINEGLLAVVPPEVDATFGTGSGATLGNGNPAIVKTIAVQSDGRIWLGGTFRRFNGEEHRHLARLNRDGTIDPTITSAIGTEGGFLNDGPVNVITLQPDGKILIGGTFLTVNNTAATGVARLFPDGKLDPGFKAPALTDSVAAAINTIVIQPDQKILIAGQFRPPPGSSSQSILRLEADGRIDPSFAGSASFFDGTQGSWIPGRVTLMGSQTDGGILLAGNIGSFDLRPESEYVARFGRITSSGARDFAFAPAGFDFFRSVSMPGRIKLYPFATASALHLQADGSILVGRVSDGYPNNPTPWSSLERLLPSGTNDPAFTPPVLDVKSPSYASADAIAVQPDGGIIIAGTFTNVNQQARGGIARLNADGSLDTWMAGTNGFSGGTINAMVIQADGRLLVAGGFTNLAGLPRFGLARLNWTPVGPALILPGWFDHTFGAAFISTEGKAYTLESVDVAAATNWTVRAKTSGDGKLKIIQDTNAPSGARFYRVREDVIQ